MDNNVTYKKQRVITTEELITPEIALEYLKKNTSNRILNRRTVQSYAEAIKKGQWESNGEAICFCEDGSLLNGQHRLSAIVLAGIAIPMSVARNCKKSSFITYDSGKNRSIADVFTLSNIPRGSVVSAVILKYFILKKNLLAFSGGKTGGNTVMRDKRLSKKDLLDEYYSQPEFYDEITAKTLQLYSGSKLLTPSEIGGLMLFLLKERHHSKTKVFAFFEDLLIGRNFENTPALLLRNKLIKDKSCRVAMTGAYKEALVKKAWNAYVLNKKLKALHYNERTEKSLSFI